MNPVVEALARTVSGLTALNARWALVGGIAVSTWADPRFTRMSTCALRSRMTSKRSRWSRRCGPVTTASRRSSSTSGSSAWPPCAYRYPPSAVLWSSTPNSATAHQSHALAECLGRRPERPLECPLRIIADAEGFLHVCRPVPTCSAAACCAPLTSTIPAATAPSRQVARPSWVRLEAPQLAGGMASQASMPSYAARATSVGARAARTLIRANSASSASANPWIARAATY